jgi:hypothetical protein
VAALLMHHLLLVVACASLAWFGWWAAGRLGAWGVERGIAAVVFAAVAAGLHALAIGLLGGGTASPGLVGLALAAAVGPAADWSAARRRGGTTGRGGGRWSGAAVRWPAGVLAGVGLVWFAWLARHPALGIDPLSYHLPETLAWVQGGRPGDGTEVVYEFPIQAYPLTNELLLAWATGIGRSFGPALAWTPLAAVLFAVSGWAGMARLGVRRAPAALAIAAVLLMPVVARQLQGPHTDLPALAWLATCWALSLAASQRTALLIPALLAGALAIGSKTTTAPYVVGVLAVAAYRHRTALRAHSRGLLLAGAAAIAVGGLWYVRNWIDHGSPLWPFVPLGGDPAPPLFEQIDTAFIERPADTLRGRTETYVDALGGPLLLVPVAVVAAAARRHARGAAIAAGVAVAGVLLWMNAPFTGRADDPVIDLSISTLRYLLPALTVATLATALALRDHAMTSLLVLGAAVLVSAKHTRDIPFPGAPSMLLLAAGAAAGAALSGVARVRAAHGAAVLAMAAAAVVALNLAADGLPARHAETGPAANRGVLRFLDEQYESDVHFAPSMLATAAGERLGRRLHFIPRDEPCDVTDRREGYVVIGTPPFADRRTAFAAKACLERRRSAPSYRDTNWTVYAR